MTIIEKLQKKADAIARRHHDSVDRINVYTPAGDDFADNGAIVAEFAAWGDCDYLSAKSELEAFCRTLGARLEHDFDGDDIEHHLLFGFRLVWDDSIHSEEVAK